MPRLTVITADRADPRPLRILGVGSRDLDTLLAAALVRTVVAGGLAKIRLWGDCWPADFGRRTASVSHQRADMSRSDLATARS
jgi:hypothetical protein